MSLTRTGDLPPHWYRDWVIKNYRYFNALRQQIKYQTNPDYREHRKTYMRDKLASDPAFRERQYASTAAWRERQKTRKA